MAARRTITSALTVVAVGLSLLAGCTPADPNLQPTYSCTPDDGSSPYACPKVQYDAKAKEAALYAEAEAVYRKFFAEEERIYRAGGVTEPTPVLLETTTGRYLDDSLAIYRNLQERGLRIVSGNPQVVWIRRAPGGTAPGAVVGMKSCKDSSKVAMAAADAKPTLGRVVIETAYFMRVDSALRIGLSSSEVVESC